MALHRLRRQVLQVHCTTCQARARSEWRDLDGEGVALLHGARVCNTYHPGQVVFYQGNPALGLHCLESGTVAMRKEDHAGRQVLVRLVHPGRTLGARALFAGGVHGATAEALTPCRVCFMDRAAVASLLDRDPSLAGRFLRRLAGDLEREEDARLQAMTAPVRARLSHLLLSLKDHFAEVTDDGSLRIHLPLSRKDMAAFVGSRPETIARVIRSMDSDGVTRFRGQTVTVPDLDALLDEVEALETVA